MPQSTDTLAHVWCDVFMLAFHGGVNGRDWIDQSDWDSAHETSRSLHQLALRYWAEDRDEDAIRVATEAARILGRVDPHSWLMAQITSTLQGIQQASGDRSTA